MLVNYEKSFIDIFPCSDIFFFLDIHPSERPIKLLVPVCLSISLAFFLGMAQ